MGSFKRVFISNIICDAPAIDMPAIIAGVPGRAIEDVSVSDVLMVQKGVAAAALADIDPPEQEREYPEPSSFGPLPARGLLVCHAKNVEFRDIAITSIQTDARPFVWLSDVDGADFSRLSLSPRNAGPSLRLCGIRNLQISRSRGHRIHCLITSRTAGFLKRPSRNWLWRPSLKSWIRCTSCATSSPIVAARAVA